MTVFPEEILERIFAHLEPIRIPTPDGVRFECDDHMQRKTLASICRANKDCNRIAYPHLYRTIHLNSFSSRPRLLLRSLLINPKLAIEVRQLRISGRSVWNKWPEKDLGRYFETTSDENLRPFAYPVVKSLPLSTGMRKHILTGVRQKLEDYEFACIAAVCPFLELLDLPAFEGLQHSCLLRIIAELYGITSKYQQANSQFARKNNETAPDRVDADRFPLSRIRDVSINRGFDQSEISIGEALPLLYLPKLETFRANKVKISSDAPLSEMPTGSSWLRVLSLTECLFNGNHLAQLLRGCSNLHTLLMYGCYSYAIDPPGFSKTGRALNQRGRQLQILTLAPTNHVNGVCRSPIGDISNLRLLRELNIPGIALFRQHRADDIDSLECSLHSVVDLLPTSLEHLNILTGMGLERITDFSPAIIELWMDHRFTNLQQVSFDRLAWTEKLLQISIWESSDSTPTRVVLKRSQ